MSKLDKLMNWRIDRKPPVMTKQFTFDSYDQTRSFVNDLADLSEKTGYYPNLTFSQSQATVTIYTDEKELGKDEYDFAHQTDQIAEFNGQQVRLSHD
jgi:pterin-4a-carbinolamine dehydratase